MLDTGGAPMTEPDKEATGAATIEAAASAPPTERPASAVCRAGMSLMPSPQNPTTCPNPCKDSTCTTWQNLPVWMCKMSLTRLQEVLSAS